MSGGRTNRRAFIAARSAAAAWPFVAYGQPNDERKTGFLSSRLLAESVSVVQAFRQGLSETGLTEGRNVEIDFRWAEDQETLGSL